MTSTSRAPVATSSANRDEGSQVQGGDPPEIFTYAVMFQKLFEFKRNEQKAAVQRILQIDTQDKQVKLVKLIVTKITEVLLASLRKLESVGFIPTSKFPEDEGVRDGLASLLENTAFLSDLLLYLPDVTQPILKKNNDWHQLFIWSLTFSRETPYIDKPTKTLLHLVAQEMNLIAREPTYFNPYAQSNNGKDAEPTKPPKKPRKKISKGPSLSGRHSEL